MVLRLSGPNRSLEVLAFTHPLAGSQLVKGTIEAGESAGTAALRELAEESGVVSATVSRYLGTWSSGHEGQVWAFVECEVMQSLPDFWHHEAPDDGGHLFRFFWHPLAAPVPSEGWHSVFLGALAFIQSASPCLSFKRTPDIAALVKR